MLALRQSEESTKILMEGGRETDAAHTPENNTDTYRQARKTDRARVAN